MIKRTWSSTINQQKPRFCAGLRLKHWPASSVPHQLLELLARPHLSSKKQIRTVFPIKAVTLFGWMATPLRLWWCCSMRVEIMDNPPLYRDKIQDLYGRMVFSQSGTPKINSLLLIMGKYGMILGFRILRNTYMPGHRGFVAKVMCFSPLRQPIMFDSHC